jgi:hypothetical protein
VTPSPVQSLICSSEVLNLHVSDPLTACDRCVSRSRYTGVFRSEHAHRHPFWSGFSRDRFRMEGALRALNIEINLHRLDEYNNTLCTPLRLGDGPLHAGGSPSAASYRIDFPSRSCMDCTGSLNFSYHLHRYSSSIRVLHLGSEKSVSHGESFSYCRRTLKSEDRMRDGTIYTEASIFLLAQHQFPRRMHFHRCTSLWRKFGVVGLQLSISLRVCPVLLSAFSASSAGPGFFQRGERKAATQHYGRCINRRTTPEN